MRICLECEHCYVDSGQPNYSELTPGYGMVFTCMKNHKFAFNPDRCEGTKQDFIADLMKANTCKDFKEEKRQ